MKILYVITKGNWGGAQKYVFDIATHLPQSEFETVVACGQGDILPTKLTEAKIRVIPLLALGRDVHILQDTLAFFRLIKLYKKERPDVVHLNSSKVGGLGALAARIAGIKKIVFTVHGFAFNEQRPVWQKKLITFMSWLTIVLCTDVIFISKTEYEQACCWLGVRNKAKLIYNGIETPHFLPRTEARTTLAENIKEPVALFENKTIIGTVAELTENKGLHVALEAVKDIPNVMYIIIGQGELQAKLKASAITLGLSKKVFFTGFIKDASLLLKAFDLFLLPSLKEGVPYVLLEAGFAGVPVIATNVGGVGEIVRNKSTGFIIPANDILAIHNTLTEVIADPATTNTYSNKLYEHVSANFTLSATVDNTIALYRSSTI